MGDERATGPQISDDHQTSRDRDNRHLRHRLVRYGVALSDCGGRSSPLSTVFKIAVATAAIRSGSNQGSLPSLARLFCALSRKLAEKPEESLRKGLEKTVDLALFQGPRRHFSKHPAGGLGSQQPKVPGFNSVETVCLRPAIRKSSAVFHTS
jgi:hypothetical protein